MCLHNHSHLLKTFLTPDNHTQLVSWNQRLIMAICSLIHISINTKPFETIGVESWYIIANLYVHVFLYLRVLLNIWGDNLGCCLMPRCLYYHLVRIVSSLTWVSLCATAGIMGIKCNVYTKSGQAASLKLMSQKMYKTKWRVQHARKALHSSLIVIMILTCIVFEDSTEVVYRGLFLHCTNVYVLSNIQNYVFLKLLPYWNNTCVQIKRTNFYVKI